MFDRADIVPLSAAAIVAVAMGVMVGAWASPPASMAAAAAPAAAQPVVADDPNLAAYKQMIAEQGGPGPRSIVTSDPAASPAALATADPAAVLDAQIARDAAAFDRQARAWEQERQALEQRRAEQAADAPTPVAYPQPGAPREAFAPESVTVAEAVRPQ